MKNTILKLSLVALTLAGITTSCSEDFEREFLDQKNPNEIGTGNFWKDLSQTQMGLNATYKMLYHPNTFNFIEEFLRSDMGYPSLDRPLPASPNTFHIHTYTSTTNEVNVKWQTNYTGIFRANQVIEGLTKLDNEGKISDDSREEWTSQMAQARFFRGMFHHNLYTTYNKGSIIIRDKVALSLEEYSKDLSTPAEVLAFIREDLEYAYSNLYKKGEYPDGDITKVTAGAAGMILGNTYLNELDYASAVTYYEDVINNHGYELESDLSKMFTNAGEFNNESILEINFTADNVDLNFQPWDGQTGTSILALYTRNNTQKTASSPAWLAFAYKSEIKDPLDQRNYYVDPLDGSTKLRNVSLRASSMLAVVEDEQTIYYQVPTHLVVGPAFNGVRWGGFGWWKKHTNHDIQALESDTPNGAAYSAKNTAVYRLSETYLNLAECKIKLNQLDEAFTLINAVRARWGLELIGLSDGDVTHTYDEVVYTQTSLMEHLMKVEKPLELGAEGHASRWLDFIRWGKSDNYGFDKRLEELANATYYGVNYNYIDENGVARVRQNAPSVSDEPTGAIVTVDYEYDLASQNFDPELHNYYPIPLRETDANNNVD